LENGFNISAWISNIYKKNVKKEHE
jgi:hypothetical protein